MRVLCVGNMYPPHHLGGYELVWQGAVAHLRSLGHEVRVLTTDVRFPGSEQDREPDVHRDLRWYWRDHRWPRMSPRARLALERHNHAVLARHLAQQRPDVVTWWAMGGMSLSLVEHVRREGRPAVGFVHDDWMTYGPKVDAWTRMWGRAGRLANRAERLTRIPTRPSLASAARWSFVSATTLERSRAAVGPLEGLIEHSGIDASFLDAAPERAWEWRLVYVGRIDPRKGIETAVRALARLPQKTTLRVIGGGEEAHVLQLRALARRLGLAARVDFAGGLGRAGVHDAYGAADATVFPVTWTEPWGLVPLESMGRGRPVVATGTGGSGEYLRDGENCVLFEAGDDRALAAAVRRLADDAGLVARVRAGGLATAPRFTEARFNDAVAREVARAAGPRPQDAARGGEAPPEGRGTCGGGH